ncbi:MAG: nucleotidyl transferase AbiEii/AbiGii toxin family protein [Planctomycetes bacterium]|nr:nucleotidyl transferase AbiEii/AbiGii toxin family protein [Planctomycetota bacterium]
MTAPVQRPATPEGLLLWIMHRFSEVFAQHAILKGGMALRLYDCPRSTTDIDYVFVPFTSKNDIVKDVRRTLNELEGASIELELHSKMLRATITLDDARIQVEAIVAAKCASEAVGTGTFASTLGSPSQVVRVMSASIALSNKLAAWNERRLHRDLYDVYFLRSRMHATIDRGVLVQRLSKIESRRPELRKKKSMSTQEFAGELRASAAALDPKEVASELRPLLPESELAGLLPRLKSAMVHVAEVLESPPKSH